MSLLYRIILFQLILLFLFAGKLVHAQPKGYHIDSLTTTIDGALTPYNQVVPGDTLLFEHGRRAFLLIRNFHGTEDRPIIMMNNGGVVMFDTDHYYGISIRKCRYFRFTGTGDVDHFYGFMISRVGNGGGFGIGDMCSDFEIDHISIENCMGVGVSAKTDPDSTFLTTRDKFTQFNTIIHDNFISGVSFEGLYIGSTKYFGQVVHCNGKDTLLMPSLLKGVRVYNNIIKYTGWDGVQVSSASSDCQIFNNLVMFDSQAKSQNQMSGILIGGGSKCDCFNNSISDGMGNGIESHGLGGYRIYNNLIVNAGKMYSPGDSSDMKYGIFVTDVTVLQDSSFDILFNDIINPKSDGIRFSSNHSRNSLIASNAIINPGNFDYYEHGHTGFKGKDSYIMVTDPTSSVNMQNNYLARTGDSAGFSGANYALLPLSPLIDAGYSDGKGITIDYFYHNRLYGSQFDIGAHEYDPAYLGVLFNQNPSESTVDLFPNPAENSITIRFRLFRQINITFSIYDTRGILHGTWDWGLLNAGINTRKTDIRTLPNGIYLYTLRAGNQNLSGRFIKKTAGD
ncbi:MAG: T9SS type A sorting domain-containing protein [Bacteroidetes bacterium]|nr:T9SS type A sorting domain-containing protein [Bacteroidota bacterium]